MPSMFRLMCFIFILHFVASCGSQDEDPTVQPGDPIQGFNGTVIDIVWDANTENDLAGYRVYYGTAPGVYDHSIDVGNVTTYPLKGLDPGTTYHISIAAYDMVGNESHFSGEVSGQPR